MPEKPFECSGGCGRMLRPWHMKKDEMKNTVAQNAPGKCATCIRREKEGAPPGLKIYRRPPNCIECEVPLRSSHGAKKPTDPVNSRRYAGRGLCATCYYHRDKAEDSPETSTAAPVPVNPPRIPAEAPADIKAAAAALEKWQALRRSRMQKSARVY